MNTYKKRILDSVITRRLKTAGAILLEGIKWCGKTTTCEQLSHSVIYMDEPEKRDHNMLMIACLLSLATMCGCRTASTPEDKAEQWRKIAADRGKVQLWEGGPYWADRNIGADKPEDYGLYFWWGDTT